MKFLGAKHYQGTSQTGSAYDFTQIAFLDTQPDPKVRGNWVLVGTAGADVDVDSLVVGNDYRVYPFFNKGRCTIPVVLPIEG